MFNKVFKYDFKFVFRFWWIFAVITLGVSVLSGLLLRTLIASANVVEPNVFVVIVSTLGLVTTMIILVLFPFVAIIANAVRYYKNFFSDEGYLTFTLPVKRSTLLNSKILNAFLFQTLSTIVLILAGITFIYIGSGEALPDILQLLSQAWADLLQTWNGWLTLSICLLPVALIASTLMGINVLYLSITIGSVISKRHKVLAGLGVYFGFTSIISIFQEIIQTFTVSSLYSMTIYVEDLLDIAQPYSLNVLLVTLLYAGVAVGAYFINLHCIKNKLNLS